MTTTGATSRETDFLAPFRGLGQELALRGPDWLRRSRRDHLGRFIELGFPSTRDEDWRNTNVDAIARTSFRPAGTSRAAAAALPDLARIELGGVRAVLVNGRFAPELSSTSELPEEIRVSSLAELLAQRPDALRDSLTRHAAGTLPAFRALNAALSEDGLVVWIPAGRELAQPIHLVFWSTPGDDGPTATHPQAIVFAGEKSRATIVETHLGATAAEYFSNAVTEINLDDHAVLEHYRVQLESEGGYHVASVESRQGAGSRYEAIHINLGGRLVRTDVTALLAGEGAECTLDGLHVTRGSQHVDSHTVLDHASPHCDSRELFKGILAGRSRSVFHGRIVVRRDAQRTDAKQSNPNLLLSAEAQAHTRPQLEIYADDVKCTHGATIGRLDVDAVRYLRSRGIPADQARNLLVRAFAGEVLDRIRLDALKSALGALVDDRLTGL